MGKMFFEHIFFSGPSTTTLGMMISLNNTLLTTLDFHFIELRIVFCEERDKKVDFTPM